jgi:hypothetical protein
MSKLLDYINHLDKDANARAAHKADPRKSMTDFGLTTDEQDALQSGDQQRVADAIGIPVDEAPALVSISGPY